MQSISNQIKDAIIVDYVNGLSARKVAEKYQVSKATVSNFINQAGVSRWVQPVEVTPELLDKMQSDYDNGLSKKAIARKYKLRFSKLFELCKQKSIPLSSYSMVKKHRHKVKEELVLFKGGECQICGYNKCIRALEFHHLNPNEKDFTISPSCSYQSLEQLKSEASKCILVCANCHREIHAGVTQVPEKFI